MFLILLPIVWLAVVTVFVAVCQASALGESRARPHDERAYRVRDGLVVWDRDAAIALRYPRRTLPELAAPGQREPARTPASRRERVALQGLR